MTVLSNRKALLLYVAEADEINLGIGFLSGALKASGWDTSLLVWHIQGTNLRESLEEILSAVGDADPFCICISAMSQHYPFLVDLLDRIREVFDGPVLTGGYHAVVSPEDFHNHPAVDVVCLGDGEKPVLDFLSAVKEGRDASGIHGLWGKGRWFSSEWRGDYWYVSDLEAYPYIDYDLFDRVKPLSERLNLYISASEQPLNVLPVVTGRGCPFRCTYCTNAARMNQFPSTKAYVRKYSPEFIIRELAPAVKKYNINFIDFLDELFIHDRDWVMEFARLYRKEVRVPFSAQIHLECITEEICEALKDCGWILAAFGLECGDEEYRRKYLRRKMTNELIEDKAALLKRYGIFTISYNIMGMPYETDDTMRATLEINRRIRPDMAMHLYWQPLAGTELTDIAREAGMLPEGRHLITNFGTSLLPKKFLGNAEYYHGELAKETFSLFNGAPNRLMEELDRFAADWMKTHPPIP